LKKILGLESFYFYTEYLGSNLIDFSGYSQKNVQIDGLDVVVYKSKKWLQFENNPLSFNPIPISIDAVDCELYVEKFSGIVVKIELHVDFNA
jgi:hypothetical protein